MHLTALKTRKKETPYSEKFKQQQQQQQHGQTQMVLQANSA